jgi:Bcr/CflA subfamily drug resistance transporter
MALWLCEAYNRLQIPIEYSLTGGNHDIIRLLSSKKDFDDENMGKDTCGKIHDKVEINKLRTQVDSLIVINNNKLRLENNESQVTFTFIARDFINNENTKIMKPKRLLLCSIFLLSTVLPTFKLSIIGLGPFSIDTYLPAFAGIATALGATPIEMQQTLSAYLFGFAFMNLFHGALADSFGRRPVVLWGIALFTIASAGCALSQSIGQLVFFRAVQGLSTGAGIVVSRAVIRDMFPPAQAQQVMSQVTIYFGVAPAVAPIVGGWLFVHTGWHSIFWFLALVGAILWITNFRLLPETLHPSHRQPFNVRHLMRGYWALGSSPKFLLLALASGVPFNGMFLYVLSAPAFLGEHLKLEPTQFFWFFVLTISGIMGGAWLSGRLAGRIAPKRQIRNTN